MISSFNRDLMTLVKQASSQLHSQANRKRKSRDYFMWYVIRIWEIYAE